jgi:hypothetical protein
MFTAEALFRYCLEFLDESEQASQKVVRGQDVSFRQAGVTTSVLILPERFSRFSSKRAYSRSVREKSMLESPPSAAIAIPKSPPPPPTPPPLLEPDRLPACESTIVANRLLSFRQAGVTTSVLILPERFSRFSSKMLESPPSAAIAIPKSPPPPPTPPPLLEPDRLPVP